MELSQLPLLLLLISNICCEHTEENPKATVRIKPDVHVFRGETVTLRCDIYGGGVTSWQYSWYKDDSGNSLSDLQEYIFSVTESDAGKYSCYGTETEGSRRSQMSDAVTLTVSDKAALALSVFPQNWLTEGDSVSLICEVYGSSTGWTFSWFSLIRSDAYRSHYQPLSDSSGRAEGNYTISSVSPKHAGVYMCKAKRGKITYKTSASYTQPLWVTVSGVSSPVSLIIRPSRAQHFESDSLSLSCEDKSNSTGWRVRRYTDSWRMEGCSSQTGSTCTMPTITAAYNVVYWCQSESGDKHDPVNITVHSGVILESPVHPVTEGESLTLRCLSRYSTPPNLRADFYKGRSLVQSQTTEMIITTVSKSHEGFYSCKHPEGESPKSWISVRVSYSESPSKSQLSVFNTLSSVLAACPYLLVTVVLIYKCYRMRGNTDE